MAQNIDEQIKDLELWRCATQIFLTELMLAVKEANLGLSASISEKMRGNRIHALDGGNDRLAALLGYYADGGMRIMSDNPNVSDETAYDGEMQLIGRVVGIFRKM